MRVSPRKALNDFHELVRDYREQDRSIAWTAVYEKSRRSKAPFGPECSMQNEGVPFKAFGHGTPVPKSSIQKQPCKPRQASYLLTHFDHSSSCRILIPRRCPLATLLYVDDDSRRLQVLPARLELLGYEVLTADNGASGLEIFKKSRVDLAIVDYYMPGMGGDIVTLEMKRIRPDVPVIIFSGTFTMRELVIAFADAFISTADGTDALIHRIAEVLPQRRRRRNRRAIHRRTSAA